MMAFVWTDKYRSPGTVLRGSWEGTEKRLEQKRLRKVWILCKQYLHPPSRRYVDTVAKRARAAALTKGPRSGSM